MKACILIIVLECQAGATKNSECLEFNDTKQVLNDRTPQRSWDAS